MAEGGAAHSGHRLRWRASRVLFVAIIVLAASGYVVAQRFRHAFVVYVAARDLRPFHQIVETDVRRSMIAAHDRPTHTFASRSDLIGRYVLAAMHQDDAFGTSSIGPQLAQDAIGPRRILSLPLDRTVSTAVAAPRGSSVTALFSPRSGGRAALVRIDGVIVLDVRQDRTVSMAVLAVPASALPRIAAAAASSDLLLVPA